MRKFYDLGALFLATLIFSAALSEMSFEIGQENPEANNILETQMKPNPNASAVVFGVDEVSN